jgi:hypothetical protein
MGLFPHAKIRYRSPHIIHPMKLLSRLLPIVAVLCLAASSARAADFNVGISPSLYTINGTQNPTLTLFRGQTYTFAVSASGHNFWIKTAQVIGTGSAFSDGITGNGITSGTLTFTVPTNAPATLFYICQFHSFMTGTINITDAPDFTVTAPSASAYAINGVNNAPLTLTRGRTYRFALNTAGHPFYFKTIQGAGTANAFNTGVTANGMTSGTLVFAVPTNAPSTLFYNCSIHAAMTGVITLVDPIAPPASSTLGGAARGAGGEFQFTASATPGRAHFIQANSDPGNAAGWITLVTNTPAGSSLSFTDTNAPALPRRFYRIGQ